MLELNQCYNMDCMKGMAQFPDGFFDLAVVDPPYFSGPERRAITAARLARSAYTATTRYRLCGRYRGGHTLTSYAG